MLKNYFKTAWRTITRQKIYAAINIAGLGVGLAASILIGLWVSDELAYDRFHAHSARIYRIIENQHYDNGANFPVAVTPGPLAPAMMAGLPEIKAAARLVFTQGTLAYKDNLFREKDLTCADPSFLTVFSFPLIKGDPHTALDGVNSVVLTASTARKLFGDEDPVGKTLKIKIGKEQDFVVTGILADLPGQTHLNFINVLLSYRYAERNFSWLNSLDNNSIYTYLELKDGVNAQAFDKKIAKFLAGHSKQSNSDLFLQPLTAIHLHSDFTADIGGHGSIQYVYIFSIVALLIIVIACINFMNLSTARYERRAKEVGVRKVIGADRKRLITQFLGESVFMSALALIFAIALIALLLPAFNNLSAKTLSPTSLTTQQFVGILAITGFAGVAAGIYPALFLSSFKPISVLKNSFRTGIKGASFREVLVVTQFVISVVLIIGTLTIGNQLRFIRDKRLGFDKDNVVVLPASKNFGNFKNEVLRQQGIVGVTESNNLLTNVASSSSSWVWEGKDPTSSILFHRLSVDYDFLETFHIRLLQGRSFSKAYGTDSASYIVNEEAIRQMKLKNPIGKKLAVSKDDPPGKIIGVVEDFNFKSVHTRIEPLIILFKPQECWIDFVRISPDHVPAELAAIEKTWRSFNPQDAYEFSFLDDSFNRLYQAEQRTGTLFQYFSGLAIFISCLGLLGLVTYAAERRTREIGIRKVLGATEKSLVFLLSKQFLRLVLIALVIAIPLSAWAMTRWLQDFAYRISLQWWVFVLGGFLALAIALLTVGLQALRASLMDPVKSLRTE